VLVTFLFRSMRSGLIPPWRLVGIGWGSSPLIFVRSFVQKEGWKCDPTYKRGELEEDLT